jgi:hypothetical protein
MVPVDHAAPLIATALTLFFYPLVFWSLRGLEVGLVTLLISLFCLQIISTVSSQPTVKTIAAIVITASLAVATRFDTFIPIFCGLMFLALYHRKAACPDLVADDWGNSASFMSEKMMNQYQKLTCDMYVRKDSKYVQSDKLICDITR